MSALWGVVYAVKIYLASPHTLTRFKGADELMKIYMAWGVSGNLNPVWKMISKGKGWDESLARFLSMDKEQRLDSFPYG